MTPGFLNACEKRLERAWNLCAGFAPDLPPDLLRLAADAIYRTVESSSADEESPSEVILVLARPDLFYSPAEVERLLHRWVRDEVSANAGNVPAWVLDLLLETLLAQLLVERSSLGEPGAQRARTASSPRHTPEAGHGGRPAPDRANAASPDAPFERPARSVADALGSADVPDAPRGARIRCGRECAHRHSRVTP